MLQIIIKPVELWDRQREVFTLSKDKEQTLRLEHSLVSLQKWESKWHKPFLGPQKKTDEESIDYIRCMTITQNVDPDIYNYVSQANIDEVAAYISDSMTATTFRKEENKATNKEIITAEIIYYWMVTFQIPFECEKWHLNRLLTLINVCSIKNQKPKKMNRAEMLAERRALNAQRRARNNSRG